MIGKELMGLVSEATLLHLQPETGRRFAEAIGIPFDDRVPPTFVGTLKHASFLGIELPILGMIQGEQKIIYHRQLMIGETVKYKRCIKDVYERVGKLGKMTFIVL